MKYTNICKHCGIEFQTNKQDKEFCCNNHKVAYNRKNNPKPKNKFICVVCGHEFESSKKEALTCSRKCIQTLHNQQEREKLRERNNEKYRDIPDIPTCKICGWKSRNLVSHLRTHNLTVDKYKEQYGATTKDIFHSSYLEEQSNKFSGENNPGYQHGGTMSSFSKKFKKYDELTDEEKEQMIKGQIIKANETKRDNNSYNTTVEFYLKQGLMEEEAKQAVSERQQTFSLEICIDKHGEEKGHEIWEQRQQKWLNTLDELPQEEKDRIYEAKVAILQNRYSLISSNLFKELNIPNSKWGKNETRLRIDKRYIFPDFISDQKIIEFNGDFWHANPKRYKPTDKLRFPRIGGYKTLSAQEVWKRDKERISLLEQAGYDVLIVWESDYRLNKQEQIQRCLEHLNKK